MRTILLLLAFSLTGVPGLRVSPVPERPPELTFTVESGQAMMARGYENTLLALGRRIRDFYLNLDNLHDYLKYTFPKMKADM